jgi:hypothetical protein
MIQRCHGFDHESYCAGIAVEVEALAAAVDGADPSTPIPTCGSWLMYQLVEHCGRIHRWAATVAGKFSPRLMGRKAADRTLPSNPADYAPWLRAGGRDLVKVLRGADPDAPAWAWGADPHAADFAPGVRNLRGDGQRLRLSCPDRKVIWTVTFGEEGFTWSHERGDGSADAARQRRRHRPLSTGMGSGLARRSAGRHQRRSGAVAALGRPLHGVSPPTTRRCVA